MDFSVDGKRVFAATGGRPFDADKPCIIFVHGAALDHTVWALQTRYFAHHGRSVLAIDLPGHGKSEGAPLVSTAEQAAWVFRLMDAAGLASAALVGHSMGSTIVLFAAGLQPDRVWACVPVGSSRPAPVHPELLGAAKADDHLGIDLINGWGHGRNAHAGGAKSPGIWLVGSGIRLLERAGEQVLYTDLSCSGELEGIDAHVAKIQCPTRFILGQHDIMTPVKGARQLAQLIPSAEVVVIPDTGHMLMAERPDEVLDAMREVV